MFRAETAILESKKGDKAFIKKWREAKELVEGEEMPEPEKPVA